MMEKKITLSDVEKVARLARLGISPKDKENFERQLNNILLYMEKLDELDTGDCEPLAHVLPLKNVLREDRVREGLGQDEALKNAPEKKDGFFIVPPVIK
ncbi:MAG: Asp-tRNA(Asn)/Glu-tRNA(Gln) amidotransferase subunit GatC [Candidatus Euphemobacter frigidus]|nr:Asp-tRNA(Asn)/Glu-tRNA(Gln) amidotransferase subunit GatC [Candidatus Euphemobacter frigidus]MDP8276264.1 Asp-tRNA(Asn)/Glu-tRNA(Gln) amidotransferase subunit GatC [Candidatus Euphemobacter frigidus]